VTDTWIGFLIYSFIAKMTFLSLDKGTLLRVPLGPLRFLNFTSRDPAASLISTNHVLVLIN